MGMHPVGMIQRFPPRLASSLRVFPDCNAVVEGVPPRRPKRDTGAASGRPLVDASAPSRMCARSRKFRGGAPSYVVADLPVPRGGSSDRRNRDRRDNRHV